jgi:hypothetical protein
MQRLAKLFMGQQLHSDQQPAAPPVAPRPPLDEVVDQAPTPEIEIPDAEVPALTDRERVADGGEQVGGDVVEDSGHGGGDSVSS